MFLWGRLSYSCNVVPPQLGWLARAHAWGRSCCCRRRCCRRCCCRLLAILLAAAAGCCGAAHPTGRLTPCQLTAIPLNAALCSSSVRTSATTSRSAPPQSSSLRTWPTSRRVGHSCSRVCAEQRLQQLLQSVWLHGGYALPRPKANRMLIEADVGWAAAASNIHGICLCCCQRGRCCSPFPPALPPL